MTFQCELNKDETNEHAKQDEEKPMRPQPQTNIIDNLINLGAEEVALQAEKTIDCLVTVILEKNAHK